MQKRAQASIFVIVGIIILVSLGLLFYYNSRTIEEDLKVEVPGKAQYAGQEELRNFMDSCIREAVFNGIEIIRLQAGYIDIPLGTPTTRVQDILNRTIVEEGGVKKVEVRPGSYTEMAYWLDSDNNLYVPSQEFIQDELARYVEDSVLECVDDFGVFREQDYNVETGEMSASVEFTDEVAVTIDYPITFSRGDIEFSESSFIFRMPIQLKKAIDAQTELVLNEYLNAYLEQNIKYLLSLYSFSGGDKGEYDLPPLTFIEASTSCEMQTWQLSEARQKFFTNLVFNDQYFRVDGASEEIPKTGDPVVDGAFDGLSHNLFSEPYSNILVSYEFNNDQVQFDINPKNGGLLRPSRHVATGIKLLPLFCNIRYQFKYTMKFPMLSRVELLESRALDIYGQTQRQDDFIFTVPIGVNLCGNQNRGCTGKPGYTLIDPLDEETLGQNITLFKSMFCDADMRLSSPMKINVIDAYNREPIDKLAVFYRCAARQNDCLIDITGEDGLVKGKLPLCVRGELHAIHEDYVDRPEILTTRTGDALMDVDLVVEPIRYLDAEVKAVDLPRFMYNYYMTNAFTKKKCSGEQVRLNESLMAAELMGDKEAYIATEFGPTDLIIQYPESTEVRAASGEYGLQYVVEGPVSIDPFKIKKWFSLNKEGGTYTGRYPYGSYSDFRVNFTLSQLRNASTIRFYLPIETTSKKQKFKLGGIIQADGSLQHRINVDDDCDPETPNRNVVVKVSKEAFRNIFKPVIT